MQLIIGLLGIFVSGMLGGLVGVGGGILMVPILLWVFGKDIHVAVGTSLALIIPTAIGGGLFHYYAGRMDVKIFLMCAVFALVGGIAGAWLSGSISPVLLRRIFAVILLIIAIKMFFQS